MTRNRRKASPPVAPSAAEPSTTNGADLDIDNIDLHLAKPGLSAAATILDPPSQSTMPYGTKGLAIRTRSSQGPVLIASTLPPSPPPATGHPSQISNTTRSASKQSNHPTEDAGVSLGPSYWARKKLKASANGLRTPTPGGLTPSYPIDTTTTDILTQAEATIIDAKKAHTKEKKKNKKKAEKIRTPSPELPEADLPITVDITEATIVDAKKAKQKKKRIAAEVQNPSPEAEIPIILALTQAEATLIAAKRAKAAEKRKRKSEQKLTLSLESPEADLTTGNPPTAEANVVDAKTAKSKKKKKARAEEFCTPSPEELTPSTPFDTDNSTIAEINIVDEEKARTKEKKNARAEAISTSSPEELTPSTPFDTDNPITAEVNVVDGKKAKAKEKKKAKAEENRVLLDRDVDAEFHVYFGNESTLANWQKLCGDLGVEPPKQDPNPLSSITKCRRALELTHVNIYEFLDAIASGRPPHLFPSQNSLSKYTLKHGLLFSKTKAKTAGPFRALLKPIFFHGKDHYG